MSICGEKNHRWDAEMKGLDSTEIDTKIEFNIAGVLNLYDGCATVELSFDPEKKRESEIRRWHDRPADSSSAGATGIHSHQIQLRDYARISGCQGDVKKSGCVDMSHTHTNTCARTRIFIYMLHVHYISDKGCRQKETHVCTDSCTDIHTFRTSMM